MEEEVTSNCETMKPMNEETMDKILYIIKDKLPKTVVEHLHDVINNIRGVKTINDMVFYLEIEFDSKIDANAAKIGGFDYTVNEKNEHFNFWHSGAVSLYMKATYGDYGKGY